ncbi:hypothetical protein SAMN02910275_00897 [Butyrivibrio sp. INlla18]|uniref:hypothetical protein n=1 Tax=Butyrivibrio sp. INlla18 TaxID=1520806 RepID=UPI00087E35D6|nr:hypothetical protein [Butyrivibrio sp. INlla18]SDA50795.1 hypothetical protein SAMN02910275_00897 [Butyrivibrio sp. INlla18]
MAKTKARIFDEMVFDDAVYAKKVYDDAKVRLRRNTASIAMSVIVTILDITVVPALVNKLFGEYVLLGYILLFGALAGIVYSIGGGFVNAVRVAIKTGKIVWYIVPFVPLDILFGLLTSFVAFCLGIMFPVFYVLLNRIQIRKDKRAAIQYLSSFDEKTAI